MGLRDGVDVGDEEVVDDENPGVDFDQRVGDLRYRPADVDRSQYAARPEGGAEELVEAVAVQRQDRRSRAVPDAEVAEPSGQPGDPVDRLRIGPGTACADGGDSLGALLHRTVQPLGQVHRRPPVAVGDQPRAGAVPEPGPEGPVVRARREAGSCARPAPIRLSASPRAVGRTGSASGLLGARQCGTASSHRSTGKCSARSCGSHTPLTSTVTGLSTSAQPCASVAGRPLGPQVEPKRPRAADLDRARSVGGDQDLARRH